MNLTVKLVFFISLSAAVLVVFVLASLFFAGILTSPFGSPGLNPCLQNFSGSTNTAKDMTGLSTCHQVDSFHGVNTSDRDFIVGGETVRNTSRYPWMVSVVSKQKQGLMLCGGSIMDDQHILTAAHCIVGL